MNLYGSGDAYESIYQLEVSVSTFHKQKKNVLEAKMITKKKDSFHQIPSSKDGILLVIYTLYEDLYLSHFT